MRSVIYTRVSSKEQVDKYSLPAQEKILRECIAKDGHEFVGIYTDAGISGERIVDRPEFMRMLDDAEAKKFDAVWVVDQDRLSRGDLADLSYIKKIFKENNIQLCTPYQKLSLSDIDDDFISDLFGILAKRERLKIRQRSDRGRKIKAEKGEWGGRTTPYGYSFDISKNKYLVINEDEAVVYREVVSLFLNKGLGIKRIAAELNKKGYKNRAGQPWRMQAVHYILRNPAYKGTLIHQKFKPYYTKANKKRWYDDKNFTQIPGAHEPLISEGTFDLIQARLCDNRSRRRTFITVQLLTGLLECPLCRNTFKVGSTSQGKWRRLVYRCRTRYAYWFDKTKPDCRMKTLPLDEYNEKVWWALQEIARRPDLIMKALEGSGEGRSEQMKIHQDELQRIEHKLAEFESYKENAVSLRVRNKINEEELCRQMDSLDQEFKHLSQRKKELGFKIEYLERTSQGVSRDEVLRYAKFIHQSDKKLDLAQKRRVLEAFVTKIPLYPNGEFELVCKFPITNPSDNLQPQQFQLTTSVASGGAAAGRYTG
ncbi:MAG: recombinase family protein [Candidatus Omnitrophota bacterium]